MYRRYYSYNDMPVVQKPKKPEEKKEVIKPVCEVQKKQGLFDGGKLFGRFELDDLILIAIVLALLLDECDDLLLLAALAFIFLNT